MNSTTFLDENVNAVAYDDPVNAPEHYCSGGIECIDAIRESMGPDDFSAFCKGNVMKYLWRYKHKNGIQDLEKAKVYLTWLIENEYDILNKH